ncbi:helix-turn-helix domain-containing protein [Paenibacillus sp. MZ04-78.2]|uniref:helix-turn-helix domain-containing protein n=1 Tax=Paenibacillus sp. MZ04-78.2 TaxID=2962034 RepID=UPI0020B78CAC|nr:helix-turn-helix domain-containing protein [Paenibacillus sp. MZ04-78.2]MCP3772728.1 helix-turn-helix domain-containing protein [Paenibacillus sp. MZ04-78.2]
MVDIKHRNNTIADFIFQLRKEKNLTYANLEELTGLRRGVLHKIQTGETKHPEFKTVKAIAPVLLVPYKKVIECYIEHENRVDTLLEILTEVITCEETVDLAPKVALRLLESPNNETEDSLERLFNFTQEMKGASLKVALFDVIIQYSRWHGTIPYLAKGLLQKYLIERLDFRRLEQTYQEGQEVLHYTDFLSDAEKIITYFRMGLHSYALKKNEECIQLCLAGIEHEKYDTELKARAYLAMIYAYSRLGNFDKVEQFLSTFEKLQYDFVEENVKILRVMVKVRKKDYQTAVPMLQSYMEELSQNNKIFMAEELLDIYCKRGNMKLVEQLLEKEAQFLPENLNSPTTCSSVGRYFKQKGVYKLSIGLVDEGVECFAKCLRLFTDINHLKEKYECVSDFFFHYAKRSRPLEAQHIIMLKEACATGGE